MRHVHELERQRAQLEHPCGLQLAQVEVLEPVLFELGARHGDRQRPSEDRRRARATARGKLAHQERERPQVVLVAVGDDDRLDLRRPRQQI